LLLQGFAVKGVTFLQNRRIDQPQPTVGPWDVFLWEDGSSGNDLSRLIGSSEDHTKAAGRAPDILGKAVEIAGG